MYILLFMTGVAVGIMFFGLATYNSRDKELEDAYNRGIADERARIIEKVEAQYGTILNNHSQ